MIAVLALFVAIDVFAQKHHQVGYIEGINANEEFSDLVYLRMQKKASSRLGILYDNYHVHCWWYEILDLLRKLALNGLMVFIGNGSAAQV